MPPDPTDLGQRPIDRCDAIAAFSEDKAGLNRPYLTASHRKAVEKTHDWMVEAGMSTRLDPLGNLIGRYEGAEPGAPCLMIGSHIDTVRDAGRYDGALGVMIGIECVAALHRAGRRLPFAVEVVAFGDEEGSRFPASMMCSRAMAAPLEPSVLALKDVEGVTLREALTAFGLSPETMDEAVRRPGEVLAYVEAHIEQGPVLEAEGLAIGVVTGIAAQLRLKAVISGQAGHAGTSPMGLRKDAVAAAAEAVLAVESICASGEPDLRGTVGRFLPKTAAYNVIAGEVEIGIDLRAASRATRDAAAERIHRRLKTICDARGVTLDFSVVQDLADTPCDPRLMRLMDQAFESEGQAPFRLLSGAGHDAIALAALCPVSMLFIRCEGGVSHHASEAVTAGDVGVAVTALSGFIDRLALENIA
jgi:allantoate deiminase